MTQLIAFALTAFAAMTAHAGDIDPSGYSLYSGGEFFVLTDGVFSSDETIQVRFEAAGRTDLQQYGGVDVRLYRVSNPLEFLKTQKNLHRPGVKGRYEGEGLANVLNYLWDSWYKKARLAWQRVFSVEARKSAVAAAPSLAQKPPHSYTTTFNRETQFKPIPGMEVVESFRYPVWEARPFTPPKDVTMEGSSSNFIQTSAGNVLLPMGKRRPGLYLVEAMIGSFRAATLVFVSDTLVVTKVSSHQALVWTVHRSTGRSVGGGKILLTDGVGVLDQGKGDSDGVFVSKHEIPERSFALMEDASGGVAVSENFFYDSEVYQPKIYVFTDRPLYQPGDTVTVRAFGRNLRRDGAKDRWDGLSGSSATLSVIDAAGVPLLTRSAPWTGIEGTETQFTLPPSAETGGYSLKLNFGGEDYGAAFRVARFTKPHFDAQITFGKPSYKVGEEVKGAVTLTYPSGQPVPNAEVDLQLRAERMTVYEGTYNYQGASPVELKKKTYRSNERGEVAFTFPAAEKPSRYLATARAFDQAAYRVTTRKEVLIEGYLETYILGSEFNATEPGVPVRISFDRQGAEAADMTQKLKSWQAIRLEDRKVLFGTVAPVDRGDFSFTPEQPGHYVIRVVDAGGVTRGVRSHVVLGPGMKSTSGQVEILADRENYSIGDTAKLILTFPGPAEDALLTLERNEVSSYGRLGKGAPWYKATRLNEAQWKVELPVKEAFAPNVVFSVASSLRGEFSFQNKGIVVKKPVIDIVFKPERAVYAPRERVVVELETRFGGKPISALVAVGVVDEMIYVLQPEIAPSISEFFHHLRRNQVRTTSSLSFYSFNPATSEIASAAPTSASRDLKLLQERARRDARDTAYWNGSLKTDANGKARFEFVMPDALTRWRMTARAIALAGGAAEDGAVGESKGYLTSNQDYYLKWTGPTLFRKGDKPRPALVAFNSTSKAAEAEISLQGASYQHSQRITLRPGANTVVLENVPGTAQDLESQLHIDGRKADALVTPLGFVPVPWSETLSRLVRLDGREAQALPKGAERIRLKVMPESAHQIQRIADDLMEYPWGCVEQTSSRLIPMVMAAKAIGARDSRDPLLKALSDRIATERRRLVSLAGPRATFTWWGDHTQGNLLMTAHAYHADFRASKFLGIEIPKEAWGHLLQVYADAKDPGLLERAYALWVLAYLGLPVQEQLKALAADFGTSWQLPHTHLGSPSDSVALDAGGADGTERDLALLIVGALASRTGTSLSLPTQARLKALEIARWESPLMRAAVLAYASSNKSPASANAVEEVLEAIRYESPTIDRSLSLAFIEDSLPATAGMPKAAQSLELGPEWRKSSPTTFEWKGPGVPTRLPSIPGASAELLFDTREPDASTLDAALERKLYRVVFKEIPQAESEEDAPLKLAVEEVKPGQALDPRALYIDEVSIDAHGKKANFLLAEIPLPPGGEVDGRSWGLEFEGLNTNFVEPRPSSQGLGYAIPIESIDGVTKVHQLVRFSSRGHFRLPPAKLFRMYRPTEKALERGGALGELQVQ